MTPASAIAILDRQLAASGQDVVLQRLAAGAVAQSVTVRAFVQEGAAQELIDGIMQQLALVIFSPTGAVDFESGAPAPLDPRIPVTGNRIVIGGRARPVQFGLGKPVAGTLVRIEAKVLG